MIRIYGYAIVSLDGMIADAHGRMGEILTVEADQEFYHAALMQAQLVVHGRRSAEGGPGAPERRRVIVTTRVSALSPSDTNPRAALWNPLGLPFRDLIEDLAIGDGIVAVIGGTDVFDLFLTIGYDAFYLSRSMRGYLPGGRPLFRAVPQRSPEEMLSGGGLRLRCERQLAADLTLATWERGAGAMPAPQAG
jgi:dihydrofolate reductase